MAEVEDPQIFSATVTASDCTTTELRKSRNSRASEVNHFRRTTRERGYSLGDLPVRVILVLIVSRFPFFLFTYLYGHQR